MNHSWWCWCNTVCLIVIIVKSHARNVLDKANDDGSEHLSPDFVDFVKELDTMVFRTEHKKTKREHEVIRDTKNETSSVAYRRLSNLNEKFKATQNAAIRDILMMKLVSYYEDKYNVARTKAYSIPGVVETLRTTSTVPQYNAENADYIERNTQFQDEKTSDGWKYDLYQNKEHTLDNNGLDQSYQNDRSRVQEVVVL